MRRVWWSRIARLLCLRGLDGMGSHAHRRVANVGASPTGSSGVCGRPLRVLTAAHCMAHSRLALRMLAARSAPAQKKSRTKRRRGMSSTGIRPRLGLATTTPALAALRLAHEHTHAEHARHARTTRARLASHAHAPRGNTRSKAWLPCSSHWPLAAHRPARRWHIWRECALQTRSPPPLRAPMHRRHAVHAINLHRCTLPPYAES